jgi:hypothetical protein
VFDSRRISLYALVGWVSAVFTLWVGVVGVWFGLGLFFRQIILAFNRRVCCLLGFKFSMESLILAQDERWRRA